MRAGDEDGEGRCWVGGGGDGVGEGGKSKKRKAEAMGTVMMTL